MPGFSLRVIYCGPSAPKGSVGSGPLAQYPGNLQVMPGSSPKPRPFLLPFAARNCFPQCSQQIFIGVNGSPGPAVSFAAAAAD